jgi:hypothetical protein
MNKTRKLFYVSGIISLIGIWSFYFFFREKFVIKKESYLSLIMPNDVNDNNLFSTGVILRQILYKKQIKIELNGDQETNQKKMELIRYEARKLKYTKDTMTVLNISLTNEIIYGDIVKLLDLCYADKHKRFVLLKKSFIIFGEYSERRKDTTKQIPMMYL